MVAELVGVEWVKGGYSRYTLARDEVCVFELVEQKLNHKISRNFATIFYRFCAPRPLLVTFKMLEIVSFIPFSAVSSFSRRFAVPCGRGVEGCPLLQLARKG